MAPILKLGRKIRHLRAGKGVSQTKLALELGLRPSSRSFISDMEKHNKPASIETIVRMAEYFEVSLDYLLRDDIDVPDIRAYRKDQP